LNIAQNTDIIVRVPELSYAPKLHHDLFIKLQVDKHYEYDATSELLLNRLRNHLHVKKRRRP